MACIEDMLMALARSFLVLPRITTIARWEQWLDRQRGFYYIIYKRLPFFPKDF